MPPGQPHVPLAAGLRLARDYPPPMLDHAVERENTLGMFKDHRAARSANGSP